MLAHSLPAFSSAIETMREEGEGMLSSLYLQPKGILFGKAGRDAQEKGYALPLAGQDTAFSLVEVIRRKNDKVTKRLYGTGEIVAVTDSLIQEKIGQLCGIRPKSGNLAFSHPLIMGVLNVTPDSFSDGGQFDDVGLAIRQGQQLRRDGADIIDVGGESTRPGAAEVGVEIEKGRVIPVLEELVSAGIACSIDSRHGSVLESALGAGAEVINDVTALTQDSLAMKVAAQASVPVVLMHSRLAPEGESGDMGKNPSYQDVSLDIYDYLEGRINCCVAAGIRKENIIVDPGIGFGKTLEDNLGLLKNIALFHGLGVPLLVGLSRKRFIGVVSGEDDPARRDPGSIALSLEMIRQGVQIVRVHNVADMKQALTCFMAISG